jgi:hypothetical protein
MRGHLIENIWCSMEAMQWVLQCLSIGHERLLIENISCSVDTITFLL